MVLVLAEILRLQGDPNFPTRNIFSNIMLTSTTVSVNRNPSDPVKFSGFGPIRGLVRLKFGV
jgi:hypothetical protein